MDKEIAVCSHCGEPMISTFAFPGSEYYCLICGSTYGMFSAKTIKSTKELIYRQKLYNKIFKVIYKDIIPMGAYLNNCKKCDCMKETHINYASDVEIFKDKVAFYVLNKIAERGEENA